MRGSRQGPGNGRYRIAAGWRVAKAALPLATLAVLALWGCRTAPGTRAGTASYAGREVVITDSEIVRMSVRTAWDAVRLRAPRFTFGVGSGGEPQRVMIQSQRSINANETPLLVVDGMTMTDIGFLRQIPASQVRTIRILTSEAAEPIYGLGAAGGAIVVETKRGPS